MPDGFVLADAAAAETAAAREAWHMRLWGVQSGLSKPWPAFRRVWRLTPQGYVLRAGARWCSPDGGLFERGRRDGKAER